MSDEIVVGDITTIEQDASVATGTDDDNNNSSTQTKKSQPEDDSKPPAKLSPNLPPAEKTNATTTTTTTTTTTKQAPVKKETPPAKHEKPSAPKNTNPKQRAKTLLRLLLEKLPVRTPFLVPRNEEEGKDVNSICEALVLDFEELLPVFACCGLLKPKETRDCSDNSSDDDDNNNDDNNNNNGNAPTFRFQTKSIDRLQKRFPTFHIRVERRKHVFDGDKKFYYYLIRGKSIATTHMRYPLPMEVVRYKKRLKEMKNSNKNDKDNNSQAKSNQSSGASQQQQQAQPEKCNIEEEIRRATAADRIATLPMPSVLRRLAETTIYAKSEFDFVAKYLDSSFFEKSNHHRLQRLQKKAEAVAKSKRSFAAACASLPDNEQKAKQQKIQHVQDQLLLQNPTFPFVPLAASHLTINDDAAAAAAATTTPGADAASPAKPAADTASPAASLVPPPTTPDTVAVATSLKPPAKPDAAVKPPPTKPAADSLVPPSTTPLATSPKPPPTPATTTAATAATTPTTLADQAEIPTVPQQPKGVTLIPHEQKMKQFEKYSRQCDMVEIQIATAETFDVSPTNNNERIARSLDSRVIEIVADHNRYTETMRLKCVALALSWGYSPDVLPPERNNRILEASARIVAYDNGYTSVPSLGSLVAWQNAFQCQALGIGDGMAGNLRLSGGRKKSNNNNNNNNFEKKKDADKKKK